MTVGCIPPEEMKNLLLKLSTPILLIALFNSISFAAPEETSQIILRVTNLSCRDCHQVISRRLLQFDENIRMNSNQNKRSLIITYPTTMEDKEIVRAIQKLGYRVQIATRKQEVSKVTQTKRGSRITYGYCTSTCNASSKTWEQFYKRFFAKN